MNLEDDDEAFLYGDSPVQADFPPATLRARAPVNTTLANTSNSTEHPLNSATRSDGSDEVSVVSEASIDKEAKAASALEASIAATLASQGIPFYPSFSDITAQSASRDPGSSLVTSPAVGGNDGHTSVSGAGMSGAQGQQQQDEEDEYEEEESDDDDLDVVVNAPNKYNVDFRNPLARQQAPNMVVSGMGLTAASLAKPQLALVPSTSIPNPATITAPPAMGNTINSLQNGPQPAPGQGQPQAGNVLAGARPLEADPPVNVGSGSPAGTLVAQGQTVNPSQMVMDGINPLPLLPPSTLPPAHAPTNAPSIPTFPLLEPPLIKDGQTIYDFDIRSFEGSGQPWRRRGADLSRWFNYGFDEDSWTRYLEFRRSMVRGVEGLNALPPGSMLPPNIAEMLHVPQQNGMNGMNGMPGMNGMGAGGGGGFGSNPAELQQMMMQMQAMIGAGAGGVAGGQMMDMGNMMGMQGMQGMPSLQGMPGIQGLPNMVGMGGMSPAPTAMIANPGVQSTAMGVSVPATVGAEEGSDVGISASGPPGNIGGGAPFNPNPMMGMMPGFNPNVGLPNQAMGAPVVSGAFRGGLRGRPFVRGAVPLRGRGGMPLPTGPRNAPAGPAASIPTGPRAQRVQRDRDHLAPSEIELDYGGGDFPTPAEAAGKPRQAELVSTDRRGGRSGKDNNLDEFGRARRDESGERDPRDASRDRDSSYSPPPRTRRDSRSPPRRSNPTADVPSGDEDERRRDSISELDAQSANFNEEDGEGGSPARVVAKDADGKRTPSMEKEKERSSRSSHHRSERDKEHRSDRHRSSRDDAKYRSSRDKEKDKERDKERDKDKYRSSREGGGRRSSRSRERASRDKGKDAGKEHRSSATTSRSHRRSRERESRSSKTQGAMSSRRSADDKEKDDRDSDHDSIATDRKRPAKEDDQSLKRSRSASADREAETVRSTRSKKR